MSLLLDGKVAWLQAVAADQTGGAKLFALRNATVYNTGRRQKELDRAVRSSGSRDRPLASDESSYITAVNFSWTEVRARSRDGG